MNLSLITDQGSFMQLGMLGTVGMAANLVSLLLVVGLAGVVFFLLRKIVGVNLENISETLPKVTKMVLDSELDIAVLIAVCEEKGTTAEELAAMFKEDQDRKLVVERRFGSKSHLTKRFINWAESQFMLKGYPAEQFLAEYLNKAEKVEEKGEEKAAE